MLCNEKPSSAHKHGVYNYSKITYTLQYNIHANFLLVQINIPKMQLYFGILSFLLLDMPNNILLTLIWTKKSLKWSLKSGIFWSKSNNPCTVIFIWLSLKWGNAVLRRLATYSWKKKSGCEYFINKFWWELARWIGMWFLWSFHDSYSLMAISQPVFRRVSRYCLRWPILVYPIH